jgi:hypothetical protein
MVAGDVADVKAAIARQTKPATLPKSLTDQIAMLSNTEDAWIVSTVPPSSLQPGAATNKPTSIDGVNVPANLLQQVQSGYAGVKFGANVALTGQAQTASAQDATNLANLAQLLQNIMQMQAAQNASAASFAASLAITAQGSAVNISASVPQDQLQKVLQQPKNASRVAHKKQ